MIKVNLGPTIALLVAGLVFAHHSQAPYDMASEVIIDGTVVELEWRNPHIAMMLEVMMEDPESLTGPANLSMSWDYRPDLTPSGLACDPEIAERFLSED